ncbi:uncharacterized protein LOC142224361 [Haematobia irritans]|uniref:uncharacterized protein LOC142224361 n=1 Tax=Haematobia irritans TaxID=7368 RepID=UPI003F50C40A
MMAKTPTGSREKDQEEDRIKHAEQRNSLLQEIRSHHEAQHLLLKEIKVIQETNQKMLRRVMEEIKLINSSAHPSKKTSVIPKIPFSSKNQFEDFEKFIQNSENTFSAFVEELSSETFNSSVTFIKTSWRRLISDQVAQQMSWQGTLAKSPVRPLSTTLAIKQVYFKKYPLGNDVEFQKTCISFFQHASTRLKKRKSYKGKENESLESTFDDSALIEFIPL